MKRRIKDLLIAVVKYPLIMLAPIWVRILKIIAYTGIGIDYCLEHGILPMRVHFYSPVPDLKDLSTRHIWERESEIPGIDFNIDRQIIFLQELGEKTGSECDWPPSPTQKPHTYYTENASFSFGCAACLYSILGMYKLKKAIEIGSGNSSLIFSSALTRNAMESFPCEYLIIDPYPQKSVTDALPGLTKIIPERVELQNPHLFDQLGENDVLFIDSGHTVRTGGDVNFLYLEILPRLAPGVIVHIHDIPLPYEYPEIYFTNPAFRVFWTESYLLQAFLCFNRQFEILLAMSYIMKKQATEFQKAFPHYDPQKHIASSGSVWIRRVMGQ